MALPRITFFDTSRLYYSGYYLNGLHELAAQSVIEFSVSNRLPGPLRNAMSSRSASASLFALSVFRLRDSSGERYFCIDSHDASTLHAAHGLHGYHLPLLDFVDCYFKVNFDPAGIAATPELAPHASKIAPIAQFMPVRPHRQLPYMRRLLWPLAFAGIRPSLGHNHAYAGYFADAKRRLRDVRNFGSLQQIKARRGREKDIDVFFVTGYHQGAEHAAVMQRRYELIKKLDAVILLNSLVGFSNYAGLPAEFSDVAQPRLSQEQYLDMLARSKVIIYTQGMEGCISSKFALAMSIGGVMLGEPLNNNVGLLQRNSHLFEQFGLDDPDELTQRAVELAAAPDTLARLGMHNARMFDKEMAPAPAVAAMLARLAPAQT